VLDLVDNQVRSLRKRQVIDSFEAGARKGAYWGIRTNIADYQLADALPCPYERTLALAETPTRLKRLDDVVQERLINWGYAVCDAALRRHVDPAVRKPAGFPYPVAKV
jgi:NTE family protein